MVFWRRRTKKDTACVIYRMNQRFPKQCGRIISSINMRILITMEKAHTRRRYPKNVSDCALAMETDHIAMFGLYLPYKSAVCGTLPWFVIHGCTWFFLSGAVCPVPRILIKAYRPASFPVLYGGLWRDMPGADGAADPASGYPFSMLLISYARVLLLWLRSRSWGHAAHPLLFHSWMRLNGDQIYRRLCMWNCSG